MGYVRLQTLGGVRTVHASVEDVISPGRYDQTVGGVTRGLFHEKKIYEGGGVQKSFSRKLPFHL